MAYKPFDLCGKKVVVTGGNGGIGFGMARALVESGADISIWGRDIEKTQLAIAELKVYGGRVFHQILDVADQCAVERAMHISAEQLGGIDAVFANAGLSIPSQSFLEIKDDDYRRVMSINLDGAVYTLREAIKQMKKKESGGSLIVISSLGATEGMSGQQHYSATKGALISVMNSCAVEFARYGIRCNAILPGFIKTEIVAENFNMNALTKKVMPRIPTRRWGSPDDFGGIAVYLTSDASKYQTGSITVIDGGYSVF